MTAGRVIVEARAPRTAAVASQEIGRDAALVEKHVLPRIVQRLPVPPLPPLPGDVSAPLFVGVYRFF